MYGQLFTLLIVTTCYYYYYLLHITCINKIFELDNSNW